MYLANIVWTHNDLINKGFDPIHLECSQDVWDSVVSAICANGKYLPAYRLHVYVRPEWNPSGDIPPVKSIQDVMIDRYTCVNGKLLGKKTHIRKDWIDHQWGWLVRKADGYGYEYAGHREICDQNIYLWYPA